MSSILSYISSNRPPAARRLAGAKPRFSPGDVIDRRFRVKRFIGRGGICEVYRVWDQKLKKEYALKITLRDQRSLTAESEALLELGDAAQESGRPNLIQHIESGFHEADPYLVLDYIEGNSLYDEIFGKGNVGLPRALEIAASICLGLRHAAENGIFHKDLKPGNVMLRQDDGQPVIIDFGFAVYKSDKGFFVGTPAYASPEQLLGKEADRRSDIYAVGIMLYEMITGTNGFRQDDFADINKLYEHKVNVGLAPIKWGNELIEQVIGPSVQHLVDRLTAPDKNQRFQDYDEIIQIIGELSAKIEALNESLPSINAILNNLSSDEMPTVGEPIALNRQNLQID